MKEKIWQQKIHHETETRVIWNSQFPTIFAKYTFSTLYIPSEYFVLLNLRAFIMWSDDVTLYIRLGVSRSKCIRKSLVSQAIKVGRINYETWWTTARTRRLTAARIKVGLHINYASSMILRSLSHPTRAYILHTRPRCFTKSSR